MRLHPSQVAGRRVYWLLTLEWGGLTLRLADDQVDIQTAGGDWLQYDAGLDGVELSEAMDDMGDAIGQLSVPLEFLLPVGTDLAARIARGDDLSSARGELARWAEGTTYEARRVVLVGRLSDPEYGGDDEPVSTSLEEVLYEDQAVIPGASAQVSSSTWAHIDTLNDAWPGSVYPTIIGKPGVVSTDIGSAGWVPGSPGVWAYYDNTFVVASAGSYPAMNTDIILVVAGHHVQATRVMINNDTDTVGQRFPVLNGFDLLGQPVAFVPWYAQSLTAGADPFEFSSANDYYDQGTDPDSVVYYGLGSVDIDDSFSAPEQFPQYVGWLDAVTGGGGLALGGKLIREAGDVLEYLLGLSTLAVDRGRLAAAKPLLSRYLLDGCISARVSPWTVLRDDILPLLPVSLVSGPDGLYPIVWRWDARPEDAAHTLDADTDPAVERVGRIRYDSSDRANRLSLKYAYSYRRGVHAGSLTFGADGDEGAVEHPLCTWSRARTGRELAREMESVWVYDTSTAYAVLEWQAYAYCLPTRLVDFAIPEADYIHIDRGDVVRVTDSTVALDDAVALVREVRTTGSAMLEVTLQLLSHPLTRAG